MPRGFLGIEGHLFNYALFAVPNHRVGHRCDPRFVMKSDYDQHAPIAVQIRIDIPPLGSELRTFLFALRISLATAC